jgi:hypothetical protein
MKKKFNKKEGNIILTKSLLALGLSINMKTNPLIMKEIIKEMRLDKFTSKINLLDLDELKKKPKSFKPIFQDIKIALLEKHPAVIEFLSIAIKKKWLKKGAKVNKSVHIIYLLEYLTSAMCNNDLYFQEVHEHIKTKENEIGINYSHPLKAFINIFELSHTFFGTAKALTVDPMLIHLNPKYRNFKLTKQELKKKLKNQKLNFLEYTLLSNPHKLKSFNELGMLNIYEAGITDYNKGLKNNALCAEALNEELTIIEKKIRYKKILIAPENTSNNYYKKLSKNYSISYPVSSNWQSLYVTWNLSFVLGNLDNLDILIAKLLIPSVLGAKNDQFVEPRCVSLWLSINYYLFRLKDHIILSPPENHMQMAQEWGEINKKYAVELANNDLHENEKEFKKKYNRFFSHEYRNFFKILDNFF